MILGGRFLIVAAFIQVRPEGLLYGLKSLCLPGRPEGLPPDGLKSVLPGYAACYVVSNIDYLPSFENQKNSLKS